MIITRNIKLFFLFGWLFLLFILIPSNKIYAQSNASPAIILSSYTIIGNALTDDFITVHMTLTNSSQNLNFYNALFSYDLVGENQIFYPVYGSSTQFIIPIIRANSSTEYDLKFSVQKGIPNDVLQVNFHVVFSDINSSIFTSEFSIHYVFKNIDAVQLLGIEAIKAEKLSDNYNTTSFKIIVINHSDFIVKDVIMDLEGKNFDFSTSIPLNNINPGEYILRYFDLNFSSKGDPEFIIKFHYTDLDGFKYDSSPNIFTAYLNSNNTSGNFNSVFKNILFIVIISLLIITCIILLFKFTRKKKL